MPSGAFPSPSLIRLTECAMGLVGIWGWQKTEDNPELSCPAFNSWLEGGLTFGVSCLSLFVLISPPRGLHCSLASGSTHSAPHIGNTYDLYDS